MLFRRRSGKRRKRKRKERRKGEPLPRGAADKGFKGWGKRERERKI